MLRNTIFIFIITNNIFDVSFSEALLRLQHANSFYSPQDPVILINKKLSLSMQCVFDCTVVSLKTPDNSSSKMKQ